MHTGDRPCSVGPELGERPFAVAMVPPTNERVLGEGWKGAAETDTFYPLAIRRIQKLLPHPPTSKKKTGPRPSTTSTVIPVHPTQQI